MAAACPDVASSTAWIQLGGKPTLTTGRAEKGGSTQYAGLTCWVGHPTSLVHNSHLRSFGPKTVKSSAVPVAFHFAIHSCHSATPAQGWMNTRGITICIPKKKKKSSFTNSLGKKVRTSHRERIKTCLLHKCWKRVLPLFLFLRDGFKSHGDVQDIQIQHNNPGTIIYCTFTSANRVLTASGSLFFSSKLLKSWLFTGLCSKLNFYGTSSCSVFLSTFTQFRAWKQQFIWTTETCGISLS